MTIEEIRKNAPTDATHYWCDDGDIDAMYYKMINNVLMLWLDDIWSESLSFDSLFDVKPLN